MHDPALEEPQRVLRVLLVDDDADVRALVELILNEDGRFHVVAQAGDGQDALDLAGVHRPDVVVLDLQMPGMDGLAALPELRRTLPGARIVVFSAFPDPFTLIDVVQRGADGYIDKSRAWCDLIPTLAGLCSIA